jgi:hypothetical protein
MRITIESGWLVTGASQGVTKQRHTLLSVIQLPLADVVSSRLSGRRMSVEVLHTDTTLDLA